MAAISETETADSQRKRKASINTTSRSKKPRQEHEETSGWEESSVLSSDVDESSGDEDATSSKAPTPSTPISASQTPTSKPRPKNYHCPYPSCNKAFTRPIRLDEHLRSHTNTRPHVCPEPACGKSYLRDSHLKHHLKSAHTSIRDYVCNWSGCSKVFATGTRLQRHVAAHEGKEKFRCRVDGCGMTFRKHNTLQQHTKSVHEGLRPFVCTVTVSQEIPLGPIEKACNAGFNTAAQLKAHQTRMHSGSRFTCDLCSEVDATQSNAADQETTSGKTCFATYSLLQLHLKTVHPPTCPQCSAVLASAGALTSHMEIYHEISLTERQSHFCPQPDCERGFTSKGNLAMHVKAVHQQTKEFVCGETDISGTKGLSEHWKDVAGCGLKFGTKGNLVGHFRQVHLGEKRKGKKMGGTNSAMASKVPSRPSTPSDLVRNLTSRGTGMQNLACLEPFCFTLFSDFDGLYLHMQNVHGMTNEEVRNMGFHDGRVSANEEADEQQSARHELHDGNMDTEDAITKRALSALQQELQREPLPIDPMLG